MHKTLVILTPGFPKDEQDSTCIPDRQIFVRTLKELRPHLNLVVIAFQYPFTASTYNWHGIKVIALGGKNKSGWYRRLTWLRAWRSLKKTNQHTPINGLLSFWLDECAYTGNRFAKKNDLKHYCWLLGQDARAGNKYVDKIQTNGDDLIALSDFIVARFEENYGINPKQVIPGAIDIDLFKPMPLMRDIDILGAGSLIPLKQYELFIDTVKFIKTYIPNVRAVLCGKGPELENLKSKVLSSYLKDNIEFKGELTHTEILDQMQRSKILLHPSNYEGFSTVLLEALYAGAHVVSFFRPMKETFVCHHIVNDANEMNCKVLALLTNAGRIHKRVLINEMKDVATSVLQLYNL